MEESTSTNILSATDQQALVPLGLYLSKGSLPSNRDSNAQDAPLATRFSSVKSSSYQTKSKDLVIAALPFTETALYRPCLKRRKSAVSAPRTGIVSKAEPFSDDTP
ncbi:MAG: hypothetical protein NC324_08460 [Bacteroides sp.]|nr:hypothetical protein [Bacteroides sp.]